MSSKPGSRQASFTGQRKAGSAGTTPQQQIPSGGFIAADQGQPQQQTWPPPPNTMFGPPPFAGGVGPPFQRPGGMMMTGLPPMQLPPGGLPPPQFAQQYQPMPPGMQQQGMQSGGGPFGGQQYFVGYPPQMQQMPGADASVSMSPLPRVDDDAPMFRLLAGGLQQPMGPPGGLPAGFLPQQQQPGSPQQPPGSMFQSPMPSRGPSRGHSASGPLPQSGGQSPPIHLQQNFMSQAPPQPIVSGHMSGMRTPQGGYGAPRSAGGHLQGTGGSSGASTPTRRSGATTPTGRKSGASTPQRGASMHHSASKRASAAGAPPTGQVNDNDNIKVVVRVRPMFDVEAARNEQYAVLTNTDDPRHIQVMVPGERNAPPVAHDFSFHGCLGPAARQADVVRMCGITQLIDAALAGFNVTIMVYGQTGSGKTFTMSGREEVIDEEGYVGDAEDGIVSLAVQYLFERIGSGLTGATHDLKASYCEIYNEGLHDLIRYNNRAQLAVRWDPGHGFHVPELAKVATPGLQEMYKVISRGMAHRRVGSHELNLESSRSHSIMTVYVESSPTQPQDPDFGHMRHGKISFVDLAGSERLRDTKSTGEMLKESTNINRSLFTLGKVISALAESSAAVRGGNEPPPHIPYRDSKLTKLLMDSLGGSALALMIACCSPTASAVEETLSTLSYATRAKNIRNRPAVQLDAHEAMIAALKREVHALRSENEYLRNETLASAASAGVALPPGSPDAASQLLGTPLQAAAGSPFGALPIGAAASIGDLATDAAGLASLMQNPAVAAATAAAAATARPRTASPGPLYNSPLAKAHAPGGAPLTGHARQATGIVALAHDDSETLPDQRPATSRPAADRLGSSYGRPASRASTAGTPQAAADALQAATAASGGAAAAAAAGLVAAAVQAADTALMPDEVVARLKETQLLVERFSQENERLAEEVGRMRTSGRTVHAADYRSALDEVDWLRSRLEILESSLLASSSDGRLLNRMLEEQDKHGLPKLDQLPAADSAAADMLTVTPASTAVEPDMAPQASAATPGADLLSTAGATENAAGAGSADEAAEVAAALASGRLLTPSAAGAPTRPPTRHARQRPPTQSANPADTALTAPAAKTAAAPATPAAAPPPQPAPEQETAIEVPGAAAATGSSSAAETNRTDAAQLDAAAAPSAGQATADAQVIDSPSDKEVGAEVVKDTVLGEDNTPQAALHQLQPPSEVGRLEAAPATQQHVLQALSGAAAADEAVSAPAADQEAADREIELPSAASAAVGMPTWQGPTVRLTQDHEAAGSALLHGETQPEQEPSA